MMITQKRRVKVKRNLRKKDIGTKKNPEKDLIEV